MAEPKVSSRNWKKKVFLFDNITEFPAWACGWRDVAAPSSFDIKETRQGVIDVVGSERAEVDLNHIYTAGYNSSFYGCRHRTAFRAAISR